MFDKSVVLNMKLASNEFGLGLGISILGFLFMMMGGVMSFAALACFLATLVFFVMGFVKLFYKSLFSNEAYLYMSLPISNLQVVLSKVFVGTLWLSLWVGLLLGSVLLFLAQNGSFLEALIGSLLIEGVPAEKIGALMVVLFWSYFLAMALFSSTLLFAIIFANTLRIQRFRIAVNFFTLLLAFAAGRGVLYVINKLLEQILDSISHMFEISLLSLAGTLALLACFIFLSERLITRRYNLS